MTGLDLFAEKNNRKFKVASHLFDKCTGALDSIYNWGEMTPPKQGNNRGENPKSCQLFLEVRINKLDTFSV